MKMKKYLFFIACLFSSTFMIAQTPNAGCDGKRYVQDLFPDTTMTEVKYGSSIGILKLKKDLDMSIVQPKGDVLAKRPLIIFAFGGGFVTGQRQDMLRYCLPFTKKGYVTATIDYRLFPFVPLGVPDSLQLSRVSTQAAQDMKAAIRYFYKDAQTTNTFKIDTNNIIVGGISAGAITAILAAQLDATDPIAPWLKTIIDNEGGLEGASGNPGYSSKVHGLINMSGSIYQKEWIDKGDVPFISFHGTVDDTVAYAYGKNVFGLYGNGSAKMYPQALKVGVPSVFISAPGGAHTNIYKDSKFKSYLADFTARSFVFCKQIVCKEPIVSFSTTGVDDIDYRQVNIFPNPSSDDITLSLGENSIGGYRVEVFDLTGRMIFNSGKQNDTQFILKKENIGQGMFVTRVVFEEKQAVLVRKIIFYRN